MRFFLLVLVSCILGQTVEFKRAFIIHDDHFVKDGEKFRIRAGEMHYSRVVPEYWLDRMLRMNAMGINTIQTYVPWNFHEAHEGHFDFSSKSRNLATFLDTANEVGLLVVLRAGPYICGEWDFGGLPAFLLNKTGLVIRTHEKQYIEYVKRYWKQLFTLIKPFLYENGGPIVMIQMENEYGSFGDVESNQNDRIYMETLVNFTRLHLGEKVIRSYIFCWKKVFKKLPIFNKKKCRSF